MIRIDEFESKVAVVPNLSIVNPTQRVFFLKEASNFKEFEKLKSQRELIKFFSQSDDFFKFFEELSWEMVDIKTLLFADSYAEFEEHIDILMRLRENYKKLLEKSGFTDRIFIPENYQLNRDFLDNFDSFELYIDGYLSKFELKLLQEVAKIKELFIHIRTSKYNKKMQERFSDIGLTLPQNSEIFFRLSDKKILNCELKPLKIDAEVFSLQNRFEQISIIFGEVENMVRDGINPENIVVVLPDDSFAENISIYNQGNYNFAMGFNFTHTLTYRKLKVINNYHYLNSKNIQQLKFLNLDIEKLSFLNSKKSVNVNSFFNSLQELNIDNLICSEEEAKESLINQEKNKNLALKYLQFIRVFEELKLLNREWLYLWLRELETIRIDDVNGGKVTVMGVLETRGIDFDGVIICDFNEGFVPKSVGKDRFLNSNIRKVAKLPTKEDRDSLQRYYYSSLMERAKRVVITYSKSHNNIASKFLYELNLPKAKEIKAPTELLYFHSKKSLTVENPIVERFEPKKEVWSATKLETWLICKRKFYYKYIRKMDILDNQKINRGLIIHNTLKKLFESRDHFTDENEFKEEFEYHLDSYLDSNETVFNYYKKVWLRLIKQFFTNQIKHFEKGWRVNDCEKRVSGKIAELQFTGIIDRVDKIGDEVLVIDYKTGKTNNKKSVENSTNFQMNIYDLLLSNEFKYMKPFFVKIFDGGEFEEVYELKAKNEYLITQIESLKKIEGFKALKCENISNCNFCQYRVICERGEFI